MEVDTTGKGLLMLRPPQTLRKTCGRVYVGTRSCLHYLDSTPGGLVALSPCGHLAQTPCLAGVGVRGRIAANGYFG